MKILVVEDEHRIAAYIKKGLELKNYVVDLAHDGQDGFDLASSEKYEVIVLDLMLPSLDGLSICKKLREENNHTPILMLTAKSQISDKVVGLDSGADDYLAKPFAFAELLSRIRALSRRPVKLEKNVLKVDDLELDTVQFRVTRSGKVIKLSKKEFALLEFLMRHKGKILSAEQITEQVWSYDSDVLPNTAQVYIGYLRTKVDKNFPKHKPLINNVRGFGYKIGN